MDYPMYVKRRDNGRIFTCTPALAELIGTEFDPYEPEAESGMQEEAAQETLTDLHWREIKRRVEAHGFEFTNKADGIDLLTKLANPR